MGIVLSTPKAILTNLFRGRLNLPLSFFASLSLTFSRSLFHTLSLSLFLTHSFSLTLSHTHSLSFSLTLSFSFSLSLSHTHSPPDFLRIFLSMYITENSSSKFFNKKNPFDYVFFLIIFLTFYNKLDIMV